MASEPTAGTAGAGELAGMLAQIARTLNGAPGPDETMQALVQAAVEVVPGAESAGITHARQAEREVDDRYASDPFVRELDAVQQAMGQGPCLDVAQQQQRSIRVDDFALETRWPQFCERAQELGAGSLLSLQLYVEGSTLAALNLYPCRPRAFSEESEQAGLLFATHAAIALAAVRHGQNLHRALYSRDVIGQAKGILMERFKITSDQAFQTLVAMSNETNTKLRDIAERFVNTGDLPG